MWHLTIRALAGSQLVTYDIAIARDEPAAQAALNEAKSFIGKNGTVVIADRLALRAESIVSAQLEER